MHLLTSQSYDNSREDSSSGVLHDAWLPQSVARHIGRRADGFPELIPLLASPHPRPIVNRSMRRVLLLIALLGAPLHAQSLTIRFLDVGQGDAALISEGGKHVLVDAGPGAAIVRYLRAFGVDTLDLLVASHNHADHIGGMTAVLGGTVVRYYMDNGVPHTTATYQRTLAAVQQSGATYLQATARTITLGTARLRILAPPPGVTDHNNASVGMLVEYGNFRAVLTGDSEAFELGHWLTTAAIPRVQVVKVAHHGSSNASTAAWAQATRPGVAVISVGAGNTYGHPSSAVLALWESVGASVYRTDRDGTVSVTATADGHFSVSRMMVGSARVEPAGRPPVAGAPTPSCCRVCTKGKACGDSCINREYQCRQPPGCACDAKP